MTDSIFKKFSIADIHKQFQDGSLDPAVLARECISTIERFDPQFHAFVSFNPNALLVGAASVRETLVRRSPLRLLEGVPVGVKDIFNTVDFPTQMGSEIWSGFTPGNDARVVYYLRNAGGLIAGKTVTAEFAVHALNETINPFDIGLTPGTSSSGSAVAVALGMVPVAIGSQTAGSIIRPASFCGVYGFKPSFGLIPRTGSLKTTDSLDTVGFFVSHPSDLLRVLEAVRVHGPNFPYSYKALKDRTRQERPVGRRWKVAFVRTHTWQFTSDYAKAALLGFVEKLGCNDKFDVEEVELQPDMECTHDIHSVIYAKSLAYYFSSEYSQTTKISPSMIQMLEEGAGISIEKYHEALNAQDRLINQMDSFFGDFDILICLSTAGEAPPRGESEHPDPALMWTLTHLPAISAPVFKSPKGLPFGLQLVARKYNDHLLINFISELLNMEILPTRSPAKIPCVD